MEMADLKARLRAVGSNQQALARFMGVETKVIWRMANPQATDGRKDISTAEAEQIERFFAQFEKPVYEQAPEPKHPREPLRGGEVVPLGRAEIPIYGGRDTPQGWVLMLTKEAQVGRALPHPSQAGARRAIAVEIVDDFMSPRFEQGELAYVSVGTMPRRGQDCLVENQDRTARVLQYVERSEKTVTFRQLNPPRQITRQLSEKLSIHAIVGRG